MRHYIPKLCVSGAGRVRKNEPYVLWFCVCVCVFNSEIAFLRYLPEFQLSGSLRGHSWDSPKSVQKSLGVVCIVYVWCAASLRLASENVNWREKGVFFFSIKWRNPFSFRGLSPLEYPPPPDGALTLDATKSLHQPLSLFRLFNFFLVPSGISGCMCT